KMGFASIINLRLDTEKGADIDAEAAAAKAAGIHFIHLPLSSGSPDPAVADQFLKIIAVPGNQPAFIHCASGNRAAAMWLIKRVLIDKWDNDRAMEEAGDLGSMSPGMKAFALDYIKTHKK
ncbi:MAG: beta-lactamase hydrolase domain-containing protein, partial [Bryobacteraceae bacterium]